MNKLQPIDTISATVIRGSGDFMEQNRIHGVYDFKCYDAEGNLKWEESIDNLVTDVGARFLLDTTFGGAANSTYFLGLMTATNVPANADTMLSHVGWTEATGWSVPATNARAPITWNAAATRSKAITAAASFTASGATTIGGAFIVTGSGAVATNASTAGTLYSAAAFGANKSLALNDILQVSYQTTC
jgi:hypothetical protein